MSKMKRFFSLLLALALLLTCAPQLPLRAEAATVASGSCGTSGSDVTWTLDDAGTLTISGTGAMKKYTITSNAPWYSQRVSVKKVIIEDGVTIIGDYAFYDCYGLTSVEIPDSVTEIGADAFCYCTSLTSVEIGDSVTTIGHLAFSNCDGLTSVEIPASVTTIGNYAFQYCTSLTSVEIPASVTTIGKCAFRYCTSLTEICFDGSAPAIGSNAFSDVTATAYYYPDETWTEDVRQNYGGTITWVAREKATIIASGNCGAQGDNVKWELYDDGLLRIFGTGAMEDYNILSTKAPWYDYGTGGLVKKVVIENGVTTIGEGAFYSCTSLANVEIPASVSAIGAAFSPCTSLTEIQVDSNNESYCDVDGVLFSKDKQTIVCYPGGKTGNYVIPDTVTTIGASAFSCCANLASVEIPDSVTTIGAAFDYCTSLGSVEIPASVTTIGNAFVGCEELKEIYFEGSAPKIDTFALWDVTATAYYYPDETWISTKMGNYGGTITWVALEKGPEVVASGECGANGDNVKWELYDDGLLRIFGTGAMKDYTDSNAAPWNGYRNDVKTAVIESGVTTLGGYAFYYCTGLTSVDVPASVTIIGDGAFRFCRGLSDVDIPDSVTSIGDYAFQNCTGLTGIDIPTSVTTIGNWTFYFCKGLTSVVIPASVTGIGNGAFSDCTGLTDVTILASVTAIGTSVFQDCTGLTGVEIPDSVTTIGDNAFNNCTSLTSVNIPASVTSIGLCAFIGCTSLTSVDIPASVTRIGARAFQTCTSLSEIKVDPKNGSYCDIDGVLFSKDEATIICYPGGRSGAYSLPTSVTTIGGCAFRDCAGLTSVKIPDSVTDILAAAFAGCKGVKEIRFEGSAPAIGISVFSSVKATAYYYPDETWTEDVRQNYGGTITWVVMEKLEPKVELSVSAEKVKQGETFTVEAVLTNEDEIRIGGVVLSYDEAVLELLGGTCDVAGAQVTGGLGTVSVAQKAGTFMMPAAAVVSGKVFTFQFKVKEDAAAGSNTIGGLASIGMETGEEIQLVGATVTVGCEHSFGPWEKVDETTHKRVCGKCSQEEIGEHEFSDWVTFEREAVSYRLRYCLCGHIETDLPENIFHLHNWSVSSHQEPTCTEDGWYDRVWCTDEGCDEEIIGRILPKLGHDYKYRDITATSHVAYCVREGCGFNSGMEAHSHTWVTDRDKTCTVDGQKTGTCVCGYSKTETIPAGHELVKGTTVAPTCTEQGYTNYSCQNCSYTEKKDFVSEKGHDHSGTLLYDSTGHWRICQRSGCGAKLDQASHELVKGTTVAPTCTVNGYTNYRCACGYTEKRDIVPAPGHSPRESWSKNGSYHWKDCAKCGTDLSLGSHAWGEWKTEKAATCTENGYQYRSCATCGYRENRVIPMTGHDESGTWQHDATGHWKVCPDCLDKIETGSHSFGAWTTTVTPTCTQAGLKERSCACGYVESESLPAEHDHSGAWQHDSLEHWRVCGKCGSSIDLGGHGLTTSVTDKTVVVDGVETIETTITKRCSTCGYETSKVYKHEHPLTEKPGKAPTCTADGLTDGVYCETCAQWIEAPEMLPALGHVHAYYRTSATEHTSICGRCKEAFATAPHSYGGWISDSGASCTQAGQWHRSCESCGYRQDSTGNAPGHDMVWNYDSTGHWQACRNYGCSYTANRGSHSLVKGTTVAPTCTREGYTPYTCTCGYTEKRDIQPATDHDRTGSLTYTDSTGHYRLCKNCGVKLDKTAHTLRAGVTVAPTCTERGYTRYNCTCGYSVKRNMTAALGHLDGTTVYKDSTGHWTFCQRTGCGTRLVEDHKGTWITDRESTCVLEGLQHRDCTVCGYRQTGSISKKSHSYGIWITDRIPSCSLEGLEHRTCGECGTVDSRSIERLPHSYGSWITQKAATCTETGTKYRICRCGDRLTETIPAKGHVQTGTWKRNGAQHWKICSRCDQQILRNDHSYGSWRTVKAATCTESGKQTRSCVCGASQSRVTAPLGHTPSAVWSHDEQTHWHKCVRCDEKMGKEIHTLGEAQLKTEETVEGGQTVFKHHFEAACTKCSYVWKSEEAVVHVHERIEVVKNEAPTCTEPGLSVGVICAECGEVLVAQEEVPAYGHDWVVGETVQPTCKTEGYTVLTCSRCGETKHDCITAPDGHLYGDDDLCEGCGRKLGDFDGDGDVDTDDVDYLLWHTILGGDAYPVGDEADFNGDGVVTDADVLRLMLYISLPGRFPLR